MDIVEFLCQHITFDLEQGPYITGGILTHQIAKQFYPTNWLPRDVDIICRSIEQQNKLDQILTPLCQNRSYSQFDYFKDKPLHHTDRINWSIQDFDISSSVHDVNAWTRINLANYTIACVAGDGKTLYTLDTTIEDIKNKILRRAPLYHTNGIRISPGIYDLAAGPIVVKKVIDRYHRYQARGFVDHDNIKEKLQQEISLYVVDISMAKALLDALTN